MPVDTLLTRSYPFLLESDVLSLSTSFELRPHVLYDVRVSAEHTLYSPADSLLRTLLLGTTFKEFRRLAGTYGVEAGQLSGLLGFLNKTGGLRRKRTWSGCLQAARAQTTHLLLGIRYAPLSWRRHASLMAVAYALLRATVAIILATATVCSLIYAAGFADLGTVASAGSFGLGLFGASLLLHEMTHIAVIEKAGLSADILQAGLRVGVIHQKLPPHIEIVSSLAGPLAGIIICGIAGTLALLARHELLYVLAALTSTFHILSLLPWYGDGKSLYRALHERNLTP